jgi:hypothetical protein
MASRLVRTAAPLLVAIPTLGAYACSSSCFGGATWISLGRGRKRLRDVQVGDVVQSFDVATGKLAQRPVMQVFRHERRSVGQLQSRAGAGPRSVTDNHPIFVEPLGDFSAAGELDARHTKRTGLYWDDQDLRAIELEAYRAAPLGHVLEVYNLSIEGTETYFADGLLVHNKSLPAPPCEETSAGCPLPTGGAPGTGGNGSGGLLVAVGGTLGSGGTATGGAAGSSGSAGEGGVAGEGGGAP